MLHMNIGRGVLKKLLLTWILPKLVSRSCESRIPRSGDEGRKVNCFVVALDGGNQPYFIATNYENGTLEGLMWDGERYAEAHFLSINDLIEKKLKITHYYGLSEVVYTNVYDLVWSYVFKGVYIKIHLYRYINATHQYFFNKKKLVTKKRMELLQFMMNDQLDRENKKIDTIGLMTKLYSIKWVFHPSRREQRGRLELYLDSLVESGEIKNINNEYMVTGKAINTLERYEEEERRHTEAVKLQKKMVGLTILIAFIALVQSGVIQLPVLLDLTGVDESHNKQLLLEQKKKV